MKYRVKSVSEEFCCDWCGSPTFQGETAWEDEQGRHYCNQVVRRLLAQARRHEGIQARGRLGSLRSLINQEGHMSKTIKCRVCGGHAWGRTESFSDDRCDDCIRHAEEVAMGPPEFVEGYRHYQEGKSKFLNPYWDGGNANLQSSGFNLWNEGWEYAKAQDH